ncbi:hypothetical protein C8J55DRAFT_496118 [Lentinula edodes]|uniref:Uncharacterized protein n=1 Tax=Lentinula lateritia TaxID=40482 RepID=A0A9W9B5L1_9AGAR|nr:hypothetical protein C8J55DRAFT_496118 [Lentinula edodes]
MSFEITCFNCLLAILGSGEIATPHCQNHVVLYHRRSSLLIITHRPVIETLRVPPLRFRTIFMTTLTSRSIFALDMARGSDGSVDPQNITATGTISSNETAITRSIDHGTMILAIRCGISSMITPIMKMQGE